jgi:hypothetical protein
MGTHWWPYQRGTFVTPPFAGYLSGHSTFSRAAAEVMTQFTGDSFFPDGMGTFDITQNDFLVFETGPTQSFTLQWATYQDASDQTSLSRIWGGIHPPEDDIKGRIIGDKIGNEAFNLAMTYFEGTLSNSSVTLDNVINIYPIPFKDELTISLHSNETFHIELYSLDGKRVYQSEVFQHETQLSLSSLDSGLYIAKINNTNDTTVVVKKIVKN